MLDHDAMKRFCFVFLFLLSSDSHTDILALDLSYVIFLYWRVIYLLCRDKQVKIVKKWFGIVCTSKPRVRVIIYV